MRRLMVVIGILLVMAVLLPVSCARAPSEVERESVPGSYPTPDIIMKEERVSVAEPAPPVVIDVGQQWATERMIVRTGDMALVVEDVPAAIDRIIGIADDFDGYVVSSRVWKEKERLVGRIAIRVPAEYFDDAMRALRGLAVEVTSESTSSKDVTEEYIDLNAKLQNLEATEEQLLRIMEKAETVEDILNVQRELSSTRGDIEQTKARMQYLERTSATSLIEVSLEQSKLNIEFTANKSRVKEREKLWFYVDIAGGFPPYSYEWDFGDGTTSTEQTPTHTYKADGSYTVSLTVTDDRGNTDTETRTDYITVLPGWSAGSVASGAWNGLVTFGHVLANIFIWIGIFSPVWIVIGGIVYWWRWRRRKRRKAD
jgi:hypothetical protein